MDYGKLWKIMKNVGPNNLLHEFIKTIFKVHEGNFEF
jgi:hypothetical protein